ncbi:unnamed protein product [Brugia timori]|uniref:Phage protein n=1 Tax=Brugia timori TaxID=42155 RepID=A0A0R3R4Y5_9BILA|nr:unnamed protein product [Brugia timori]
MNNNLFQTPNEQLVRDYLITENKLKKAYDTIKTGKVYKQEELKELYKPIIDPLNKLTNEIEPKWTKNVEKYAQNLPKIFQNQPSAIELESIVLLGKIAQKYLSNYVTKDVKTDKVFGIRIENENLYMGNQHIWIKDNDILFEDGTKFDGTKGLWELMTLEQPKDFDDVDRESYAELLQKTNSYKHNNDPNSKKVKSSTGYKYKHIVKPLLLEKGLVVQRTESAYQKQFDKPTGSETAVEQEQELIGSGLNLSVPKMFDLLKKLVSIYRNIQEGNLDPECISETINQVKKIPLSVCYPNKISYWDTLEELFQRLAILYGEMGAGNMKPELMNEAVAIMQELKEL